MESTNSSYRVRVLTLQNGRWEVDESLGRVYSNREDAKDYFDSLSSPEYSPELYVSMGNGQHVLELKWLPGYGRVAEWQKEDRWNYPAVS